MKIIVQKFGGTSVASEEARVAVKNKVQQAIRHGYGTQGRTLCNRYAYRYPEGR